MRALVIHAHPEPQSFCSALMRCAVDTLSAEGYCVTVSDLYADGFEAAGGPRDFLRATHLDRFGYQREQMAAVASHTFEPKLAAEIDRLLETDLLILNFPLWWFGLPAILKGWVDRVFAMGVAYGPGQAHATGPLRGKRTMLALTTGSPAPVFSTTGMNGDINALLFPIQYGMLHFVGMDVLPPFIAFGAARCDDAQRVRYLDHYAMQLRDLARATPLTFDAAAFTTR